MKLKLDEHRTLKMKAGKRVVMGTKRGYYVYCTIVNRSVDGMAWRWEFDVDTTKEAYELAQLRWDKKGIPNSNL